MSLLVLDTGTAGDSIIIVNDAGSGVDVVPAPAVACTVADSGMVADSLLLAVAATISDFGTAADIISVSVSVPVADSGSGIDQISLAALLQVIEAASGTEVVIHFDAATRIATITFSLARRSAEFILMTRSMDFSFARRDIAFQLH